MQRKVFRIEEIIRGEQRPVASSAPLRPERDTVALIDLVRRHRHDIAALIHDGEHRRMAVAAGELGAAVESTEKATHNILTAAETIGDSAKALAFAAKSDHERTLADDIQGQVRNIYEACNFQDLAGQRIGKVIDMLSMVEAHLSAMLTRGDESDLGPIASENGEGSLLNGPKLDGASGHVSQREIDTLFG